MSEDQQMRKVIFAINITIDGYCGHEEMIADDKLHEYFTGLLRDSGVEIFGRNTSVKNFTRKLVGAKTFRSGVVALQYKK